MSKKMKSKTRKRKILSKRQNNFHVEIANTLNRLIDELDTQREKYVKNPHADFTRNRKCTFKDLLKLTLVMGGSNLHKELYDYFDHDPKRLPSPSALLQQKAKLKESVFEDLFHGFNASFQDTTRYKGYKLYAVDGTDLNVAYDESKPTHIRYQTGTRNGYTGYNLLHCNLVYDLLDRIYVDVELQPKQDANERKALINMLKRNNFPEKTLLIGDRGYPSWNVFTHFKYTINTDFLIRYTNDQSALVSELPLKTFDTDKDVVITTNAQYRNKPGYYFVKAKKNVMKSREYSDKNKFTAWDFKMFESLQLRIVRFKITDDTYETVVTSLPRDIFPINEIKKLYSLRWKIETSFRELKYNMGLTHLHARREDFIRQEIFARLIMYNFCGRINASLRVRQNKGTKYEYSIHFKMGMRICIDYYRGSVKAMDFYFLIEKHLVPIRPGRSDERKIKPKSFVSFSYRVA